MVGPGWSVVGGWWSGDTNLAEVGLNAENYPSHPPTSPTELTSVWWVRGREARLPSVWQFHPRAWSGTGPALPRRAQVRRYLQSWEVRNASMLLTFILSDPCCPPPRQPSSSSITPSMGSPADAWPHHLASWEVLGGECPRCCLARCLLEARGRGGWSVWRPGLVIRTGRR